MNARLTALLAVASMLVLTSCKSPEHKLEEVKKVSPEKQFANFFGNICIATSSDPRKIVEKLNIYKKNSPSFEIDKEQMNDLHANAKTKGDKDARVFGIIISGHRYAIVVNDRGVCSVATTNLNEKTMREEFHKVVDRGAENFKTVPQRRKADPTQPNDMDIESYFLSVNDMAVGSELALAVPRTKDGAFQLTLVRLITAPTK
jgi:hypothetical protein